VNKHTLSAPPPDLRIIPIDSLLPHEEHDPQRSEALVNKLQSAEYMINPPIVAPVDSSHYVILDGANRCYTMKQIGFPHIIVQVVTYDSGYVELDSWKHVVSDWELGALLEAIKHIDGITIHDGQDTNSIAHIVMRSGQVISLLAPIESTHERNTLLREFVNIYKTNAKLYRTALMEPDEIWLLYPSAIALVIFPKYAPADIIAAAKYKAFLPPGISRHIIHGRALKLNYPMSLLLNTSHTLLEKNQALSTWVQSKMTERSVRYYAEATYQFDE